MWGAGCRGYQAGSSVLVTCMCPQPGPVQRREHDGPLQPGCVLRADAAAHARWAGPGGLAGPGEPAGADAHLAARTGFPTSDPAARPRLREVHGTAFRQLPGVRSSCCLHGGQGRPVEGSPLDCSCASLCSGPQGHPAGGPGGRERAGARSWNPDPRGW